MQVNHQENQYPSQSNMVKAQQGQYIEDLRFCGMPQSEINHQKNQPTQLSNVVQVQHAQDYNNLELWSVPQPAVSHQQNQHQYLGNMDQAQQARDINNLRVLGMPLTEANHQKIQQQHQSNMVRKQQDQDICDLGFWSMPLSGQLAIVLIGKNAGESLQNFASCDDRKTGLEEDRENFDSPWRRVQWTEVMGRLLITAASYLAVDNSFDLYISGVMLVPKRSKWKIISKVMAERGFVVSPQQCEDKFNDLNKRYKRLNDILGGTYCDIVEDPSLLNKMDIPSWKIIEALKMLRSKQLFYREMCSYHSKNHLYLPHDWDLRRSLQVAINGNCFTQLPDGRPHEEDGDAKCLIGTEVNRQERPEGHTSGGLNLITNINMSNHHPSSTRASATKRMTSQLLLLEKQKLHIQEKRLELEKMRLEWLYIDKKEDKKLDKMRWENERMKFENMRLEAELEWRKMDFH